MAFSSFCAKYWWDKRLCLHSKLPTILCQISYLVPESPGSKADYALILSWVFVTTSKWPKSNHLKCDQICTIHLVTRALYLVEGDEAQMLWQTVWPDLVIYWTLGNFLKHLATINLPKSPTFLGNFCKNVKIFNFSSEIIFGQLL